ncbi:MAG TPA: GGDEF domain-containing protein [Terriglobia bacterium]|nr:GGDEF domain-containing protein [Terriglobia bacterium]
MSKGNEGMQEYWLDLITDTVKQLDVSVRGAFLQKFLQTLVGRGASQEESITHWEGILARQSQWAEKLGRPVKLRTAVVDYFEELNILRNPVLLEYEDLKKLRYDAATDSLTGLHNRRMFEEYLDQEIDRSTRYAYPFVLLSFDLRNFKSVNDAYGHAAGDQILRTLARSCRETLRGSDIACRTGGDEFAIILPQADRQGSEVLAERIARKFEEGARSLAPSAPVGIDYGIAVFPEDGHDVTSLIAAADRNLYASKGKKHEGPKGPTVAPQLSAPTTEEAARQIKVEKAQRDVKSPPSPPAPPVTAGAGKKVQISEHIPDGRRFERIRMEGGPALGLVRVGEKSCTVQVLDASRGGVGILVDQTDLPETFRALLQVPMLFGGELSLQRVYSLPLPEGKRRVGCRLTFISGPK